MFFDLTKKQVEDWLDFAEKFGDQAGKAGDPGKCPLALAYCHAHPHAYDVNVGSDKAYLMDGDYDLHPWQKLFVNRTDARYRKGFVPVDAAREVLAFAVKEASHVSEVQ